MGALAASAVAGAPGQIENARDALARGDLVSAEVALDRAEEAGATASSLAVLRGDTCLRQYDLVCARRWLTTRDFAEGERLRGYQLLGRLERLSGNPQAAAEAYDRALAIDARNPDLWVDIAELRLSYSEEAIGFDAAGYALELDPKWPRALALQARLVRQRDGWLPSLPLFVQALDAAPQDVGLLADYTAVLGEAGRGEDFLAASRKVAEIGLAHIAWYQQAVLAARAGEWEIAQSLMERIPSAADREGVAMLRAMVEMKVGSLRNAQADLERLHARKPTDRTIARMLAKALALGDRNEALVAIFGPSASRPESDPYLQTSVARALERLGRRREAAALLDAAPQTGARGFGAVSSYGSAAGAVAYGNDPYRFDNVRDYTRGLIGEGRRADAVSISEGLAARFRHGRNPQVLAGDAAFAAGDVASALAHYERAASIGYTGSLLLRLVAALEGDGRAAEARRVAQAYLARRPGHSLATRVVAIQAANVGDWPLAQPLLDYLVATSGANDVVLMSLLSQAKSRLGDAAAAETWAERAMALQPTNNLAAASLQLALELQGESNARAAREAGLSPDGSRYPRALNRLRGTAAQSD